MFLEHQVARGRRGETPMKPASRYFVYGLMVALCHGFTDTAIGEEAAPADSSMLSRKHLSYGHGYFKRKSYDDAEAQLLKSFEFNPKQGNAAYYLGRTYSATDRYDEALEWFDRALRLIKPTSSNFKNSHYFKAQIYQLQDDRENAIESYRTLLELGPKPKQRIQYLHHLVTLLVEEEDYEAALEYARTWRELEPDDPEVRDMIAELAIRTGGADEALTEKEKILEMNPNDWETLEWLGNQYNGLQEYEKAFDAFDRLHEHNPTNFIYLDNLLELSNHTGKGNRYRVGVLQKMHDLQPKNLKVLESLADQTASLKWINAGLKVDGQSGRLNFLKGEHYYKRWNADSAQQDSVRALTWYKKALSDPQWADNAQRMIWELDPPLTEEEKRKREFFDKSKDKKEEVKVKGKK